MNKKIYDLAIKCANHLDWDYTTDPEFYTYSEDNVERFAHLVVKDAIKMLKRHAKKQGDANITVATVEQLLKQHFEISK